MTRVCVALFGLALFAPFPALAQSKDEAPKLIAADATASDTDVVDNSRSVAASRVIDWVAASGDNRSLPYVVIDKNAATAFLFDATGKYLSEAPVLLGIAPGDEATPGIGAKSLAEIGPAEKTTPAGRFLAKFGRAAGNQRVLWVDYATSVAMHTIPKGSPREKRRERILSPTAEDNRITFGCINVPIAFYNKGLRPLFQKKGGYVYILPDTKPLEAVFPPLHVQSLMTAGSAQTTAE